jgi:hypothetical protein
MTRFTWLMSWLGVASLLAAAGAMADPLDRGMVTDAQGGAAAQGDSLHVSGVVTNANGGASIVGATVTVALIVGVGAPQTATATTNAQGQYAIAMVNDSSSRDIAIAVAAAGFDAGRANIVIAYPADGNADRITRNFRLVALTAVAPAAALAAKATVKNGMACNLSGRLLGTWSASRIRVVGRQSPAGSP